MLNAQQRAKLLQGIHPGRIQHRSQGGKQLSYVEGWDVRATLIRIFGFGGFSADVLSAEFIPAEHPTALVVLRLTIHGIGPKGQDVTYTEAACGTSRIPGDYDMAVKTAETDALKRAAVNLGDAFGLSLYNNGSTAPVIVRTLDQPDPVEEIQQIIETASPDNSDAHQVSDPKAAEYAAEISLAALLDPPHRPHALTDIATRIAADEARTWADPATGTTLGRLLDAALAGKQD
jgi:recombination DNA repair RAD52 pathway protein